MLPQNGTKRNVSSPHLPVTLPICQGDSHSPFLALVTVNARERWWWWGWGWGWWRGEGTGQTKARLLWFLKWL